MIAPSASAVASQRRKRTTAAERIRARDAINPEARQIPPYLSDSSSFTQH
jgi:hypothetical protein